jgi:K+ transporter
MIFICPDGALDLQPLARFLWRAPAIPERLVLVRLLTEMVPRVAEGRRVQLEEHDQGVCLVTLLSGYDDEPDVPNLLQHVSSLRNRLPQALYCVAHSVPAGVPGQGMVGWRRRLHALLAKLTVPPERYLNLPCDRTLIIDRAGTVWSRPSSPEVAFSIGCRA